MSVVISIYLAVDLFEKIDKFLEAKVAFLKIIIFFAFKIPYIIMQISPVCVLLAVIITFSLMVKNNEMLALKSSGVSLFRLFRPVFGLSLFFTIALFLISEIIVPATVQRSNKIWQQDVKKHNFTLKRKNIWIKGDGSITHIRHYDPAKDTIFGLTYNVFSRNFKLIRRIDAKKGIYKDNKWILSDVMEQNPDKEKNRIQFYTEKTENFDFLPGDLYKIAQKSEEISFFELSSYIDKIESEGYDATTCRVDFHAKTASPFVCIIMCLIGAGVALKGKITDSIPVKIAMGVGIAFFYWIIYSFCVSLGYGQVLAPPVAAWAANVIFSCSGIYLLARAE